MWRQGAAFTLAVSLHIVVLLTVPEFHFSDARTPAAQDISVHLFSNTPTRLAPATSEKKSRAKDTRTSAATAAEPLPAVMPESAATTAAASDAPTAPATSALALPPLPITAARVDTRYLDNPAPPYPPMSRRLGETGQVMLRVQVNAQGTVLDVAIEQSSGYPRLDAAARAAVMKWRFVPARQGDDTIGSYVRVPMRFGLES